MKVLFFILLIALTSCKAQEPKEEQVTLITKTCLAELISSNDEVECFAFYFDIKPDSIKANLNAYRVLYSTELRDAGWNPQSPYDLINFRVPFNRYGNLITWEQFKAMHHIIKDDEEHRVYHYPTND